MVNPRTYFDVTADNKPLGRIIFELFSDTAPKTCENFRALCTGEKGLSPLSGYPLYYKNSIIHRSIKDFMLQGGDFTKRNGTGGESIYGGTFPDEDLSRPLDAEGLLCMANKGPNTNGSQFFITLRACPHLNGKHVVFGKVIRGYDEVAKEIEKIPVDQKDRPSVPVVISNCGELVLRSKQQGTPKVEATKSRSASESASESESDDLRRHKKRRHRHRSKTPDSDDERHKHHKKSKRKHRSPSQPPSREEKGKEEPENKQEPEEETEEQYDARLEREEKERLEAARKKELERLKSLKDSVVGSTGVRFKGRGRMKYVDPELRREERREYRQ